jgi:prolipoprotein diacylglyceryltransferase
MEFNLLWAALTAVALMWMGTRIWSERTPDKPLDHLIGAAAVGLFVGRLAAMIDQGINPLLHPADIIIVRGGVHTGAATIGALATLTWTSRRDLGWLDALAPSALAGLAGWHLGCLWRGACLGAPSDLPWAWAGPASTITRHPVEIYAFVALLAAAWIVSGMSWALLTRAGTAVALAGLVRLATEPIRPSLTGGPVGWYVAAIVVGTVAVIAGRTVLDKRAPPDPT